MTTQIKALSISNAAYLLSFSISPTVQKISTKTCGYDVIKLTLVILSDFFCVKMAFKVIFMANEYDLTQQIISNLIGNLMRIPKLILQIMSKTIGVIMASYIIDVNFSPK